ncbi:unnamed protein product [Strongylus vulgaris]|uniref:Zasp-like motif domain-containing protein n=1 Tax=Strongylus vulgaris TaxID=40348 RepID=A0A3P7I1M2_STRVU|nr:unnamed protein product [Strongylus vulgaris]
MHISNTEPNIIMKSVVLSLSRVSRSAGTNSNLPAALQCRATPALSTRRTYVSSNTADGSNADLLLNSGYNANQIDYVRDHFDKYRAGPKYPGSHYEQSSQYSKSYSSSTQQQNVTQQEPIPLSGPGQTYSYSTETRVSGQYPAPAAPPDTTTKAPKSYIVPSQKPKTTTQGPLSSSYQQSSYNQSSYSTEQSKPIPIERRNEVISSFFTKT